ncbi:IMPACT family protein [Aeromicrobium sp.]|uniref:IMPACT family protein n=1 Tax=Aeromicrobium sp. TaxID=1871063 RepID=UPI002FC875D9
MSEYRTIARDASAEIEVKRSRFLCEVRRVESEADARTFIESVRKHRFDARHHCTAFVIGPDFSLQRSNDDGEPAGTAGTPMLEVVTRREVSDVVAVVTRWFGGTLLGSGGLARAYGEVTGLALDHAGIQLRTLRHKMLVTTTVAEYGSLDSRLRTLGQVVDATHGAHTEITVVVADPQAFVSEVARASGGRASVEILSPVWVDD